MSEKAIVSLCKHGKELEVEERQFVFGEETFPYLVFLYSGEFLHHFSSKGGEDRVTSK